MLCSASGVSRRPLGPFYWPSRISANGRWRWGGEEEGGGEDLVREDLKQEMSDHSVRKLSMQKGQS